MKIIKPNVELIEEDNPLKMIELAGRTCYKSENNITCASYKAFVNKMIKSGHTAMLEHGIYHFKTYSDNMFKAFGLVIKYKTINNQRPYKNDQYSFINITSVLSDKDTGMYRIILSVNLRAILETKIAEFDRETSTLIFKDSELDRDGFTIFNDFDYYKHLLTPEEIDTHTYTTMRFTCDRGVSHELVRHRKFSFAQESTRYVNYAQRGLSFVRPANFDNWTDNQKGCFISSCDIAESNYDYMIENKATPQQARALLPNAIKTEVVVTGNCYAWNLFFNLRCAKDAHPDMQEVANMAKQLYDKKFNIKGE